MVTGVVIVGVGAADGCKTCEQPLHIPMLQLLLCEVQLPYETDHPGHDQGLRESVHQADFKVANLTGSRSVREFHLNCLSGGPVSIL